MTLTGSIVVNHLRNRNPYLALIFQCLLTSVQNGIQAEVVTLALNYYIFPPQESIHLQLSSFPSLQEEDKSRKDDSEKEKDKTRDKPSEKSKIRMLSKGELEHHFLTLLNWGTSTAGRHCKLNMSLQPRAFCTYFPKWSCMCKRKEKNRKREKRTSLFFGFFVPAPLFV